MTTAVAIALADEVAKDLTTRSGGWSQSFVAEREYSPTAELEETNNLKVTVAIAGIEREPDTRAGWQWKSVSIDVGVQYRASPRSGREATVKFDSLMLLLEEIAGAYELRRTEVNEFVLDEVQFGGPSGTPYVPDHINRLNQFTGVVRFVFRR